jgi:xanthine dehydrogenase YagS FAD-binding subunit
MTDFDYVQPKSLEEASSILQKAGGKAIPYSGGTDALSLLKEDIISPEEVINLKKIPKLNQISYEDGKGLKIGALVTINEVAENPLIAEKYTVLSEAANKIASPQLRNVGTVGGNLNQRPRCWYFRKDFDCIRKGGSICYAVDGENKYHCILGGGPCYIVHPSDMAVALLALDASITIFSGKNYKTIPIADFFVLPEVNHLKENILQPGEILTGIIVPELPDNTKSGYYKFMERDVWDFAVVSAAAVLTKNGNSIKNGKVAFGGVAPVPWLDKNINTSLKGLSLDEASIERAVSAIFSNAEPLEQNEYKIPLARNITRNLIRRLTG